MVAAVSILYDPRPIGETAIGIFKAYDIRGLVPRELDEAMARRVGRAFASFLGAKRLVVGRDARPHSPAIAAAAVEGMREEGATVVDVGLASTPMAYFAIATLPSDGGLNVTASHNSAEYNGFKLCRAGARALSADTGIKEIERRATGPQVPPSAARGGIEKAEVLEAFAEHVTQFAEGVRPVRVAIDCGNGMAGLTIPEVLRRKKEIEAVPLCFEVDCSFPNHEANPLKEETLAELKRAVRERRCAAGVAFDGDADRCVFVDERGETVPADLLTALLARHFLARRPGAAIVYDLRSSRVVPEEIARAGGRAVRERVGHSFIKETIRREGAIFGGELSGHYYFEENFGCDSGEVAFAATLAMLAAGRRPLSERIAGLRRYPKSPEINFRVRDVAEALERAVAAFPSAQVDRLDGVTIGAEETGGWWWANLRPSNTEPLLRLNLEASRLDLFEAARRRFHELLGEPAE
ncbi:MAG TPA: phosphomannomutase/phosphoglucomutase [Planctomycetota bacterium]|jgi:phosphomannomutase|nr:phosphomannomutase/phosphoglucomutase [Planctomycetota bacterium]